MNQVLGKLRGRRTYWLERLKERASHRWLHFEGTLECPKCLRDSTEGS